MWLRRVSVRVFICYQLRGQTHHAKPTPQASFSKPGSYNPLDQRVSGDQIKWRRNGLLLHRKCSGPRLILLCFVLVRMVRLVLSIGLGLSVVEIVDSCHIRQKSGDFLSISVAKGFLFWEDAGIRKCLRRKCVLASSRVCGRRRERKYGREAQIGALLSASSPLFWEELKRNVRAKIHTKTKLTCTASTSAKISPWLQICTNVRTHDCDHDDTERAGLINDRGNSCCGVVGRVWRQ